MYKTEEFYSTCTSIEPGTGRDNTGPNWHDELGLGGSFSTTIQNNTPTVVPPGGASASTLGATARSDRRGGESGRQGFCPVDAGGSVRVGVGPDVTVYR
jgi:hypothetical protein